MVLVVIFFSFSFVFLYFDVLVYLPGGFTFSGEREKERESKGETRINLCTACALLGCFAPGVYCIRHHVLPPP